MARAPPSERAPPAAARTRPDARALRRYSCSDALSVTRTGERRAAQALRDSCEGGHRDVDKSPEQSIHRGDRDKKCSGDPARPPGGLPLRRRCVSARLGDVFPNSVSARVPHLDWVLLPRARACLWNCESVSLTRYSRKSSGRFASYSQEVGRPGGVGGGTPLGDRSCVKRTPRPTLRICARATLRGRHSGLQSTSFRSPGKCASPQALPSRRGYKQRRALREFSSGHY